MKPILFSTPMVQAILAGRKTQTRRVIKIDDAPENWQISIAGTSIVRTAPYDVKLARYKIGDILWVRETWNNMCADCGDCTRDGYLYKADGKYGLSCPYELQWVPSIFMPRAAARIFLRVTDVRVERVQEITEEDAIAEGIRIGIGGESYFSCRDAFVALWNSINAKRGYGWDSSPWVWCISFERISKEEAEAV